MVAAKTQSRANADAGMIWRDDVEARPRDA
jgi:hypothetical protein